MEQNKQVIAAFITAIVAIGFLTVSTNARADDPQVMEKCFGVVKAGQNDCDTDNGQCAPSLIDASPNEWIYLPKGICDKLVGGISAPATTVPPATPPASTKGNAKTTTPSTTPPPAATNPNSATGGFNDGMNTPNTPYVNDY